MSLEEKKKKVKKKTINEIYEDLGLEKWWQEPLPIDSILIDKIAIVGSRKRKDIINVYDIVDSLDTYITIVSGGCKGIDNWAIERAEARGMKTKVFKPIFHPIKKEYYDIVKAYYARNKKIAEYCDVMIAFVSDDRTGGTENAIYWAKKFNKQVILCK